MSWSRRKMCLTLPALLASASSAAEEKSTLPSRIYHFDELPVRQAGSLTYRGILEGKLYEGCQISLHESVLAPRSAPHAPHRHKHEEMILIVEGTLEFTVNGESTQAGAGSMLFVGSNGEHGIRNPAATHAKYFVMALGPESE